MRIVRIRTYAVVLSCIAGLAALFTFAVRSPRRELLDMATRATSVANWNLDHADYHWLSNHEILYFRGDETGGQTSGWTLYTRDLSTGKDEELKELTGLFRKSYGLAFGMSVSPDGTKLLWPCSQGYFCATPRGQRLFRTTGGDLTVNGHWQADNRHWMEFALTPNGSRISSARIHDLGNSTVERIGSFSPALDYPASWTSTKRGTIIMDETHTMRGPRSQIRMIEVDFTANGVTANTATIGLPTGSDCINAAFSPKGDRVAWIATADESVSQLIRFWRRLFPARNAPQNRRLELWVSGLRGANMRRIGSMDYHDTRFNAWKNNPHMLRWLPDDRILSFIHDGSLWTIPFDR